MAGITIMSDGKIVGSTSMGRFVDLTDAPTLTGKAGQYLVVNGTGTGLALASGVVYGDLEFSDLQCVQCGKAFTEGDKLVLVVVKVEAGKIVTRPAHHNCVGG